MNDIKEIKIEAYLKPTCGWSQGVRAIMNKYNLDYIDHDIISDPNKRADMERLSGQPLSPCVIINDQMLADVSGEEVEQWLITNNLVQKSDAPVSVSINSSCQE